MKISIKMTPNKFKSPDQVRQMTNSAWAKHSASTSERLVEPFSEVLRKGAKEGVGATGAASENLFVRLHTSGDSPYFEIYEGSATIANEKIREGLPKGHKVPYDILRTWAANKGLKLYYEDSQGNAPRAVLDKLTSKSGVQYERSRWFGRVGIKPQSKLSPSQVTEKAIHAIRMALYQQGTERPTASWFRLHPAGAGKFDYPEYVFTSRRGDIDAVVNEFGAKIMQEYDGTFRGV